MRLISHDFENVQFHRGYVMKVEFHRVNALEGGFASEFINKMFVYIIFCSFFKNLGK